MRRASIDKVQAETNWCDFINGDPTPLQDFWPPLPSIEFMAAFEQDGSAADQQLAGFGIMSQDHPTARPTLVPRRETSSPAILCGGKHSFFHVEGRGNPARLLDDPRRGSLMSLERFVAGEIGINAIPGGRHALREESQASLRPVSFVPARGVTAQPTSMMSLDGETQRLTNEVYDMLDNMDDNRGCLDKS